LEEIFKRT